jgi:hypothetical protein
MSSAIPCVKSSIVRRGEAPTGPQTGTIPLANYIPIVDGGVDVKKFHIRWLGPAHGRAWDARGKRISPKSAA